MKQLPLVLSASRMTDMPKYYPDELIREVEKRIHKGIDIHTLVVWTKHPDSVLAIKLRGFLEDLIKQDIQIYVQCTITGMGGTKGLEPNAPNTSKALSDLEKIVELVGSPQRLRLRVDPLVRIRSLSSGESFSNLKYVKPIVKKPPLWE